MNWGPADGICLTHAHGEWASSPALATSLAASDFYVYGMISPVLASYLGMFFIDQPMHLLLAFAFTGL